MKMCDGFPRPLSARAPHEGLVPGRKHGRAPAAVPPCCSRSRRCRSGEGVRFPKMSTSVPQGHNWTRQVKKEDEEEDPLDQLISRSGCAASHFAVQECMAQHQDWRQCQPQVQAFRDCMSEQQARRREELQRRKEQANAHC
nr:cytochrome c oxidase assembly factor 4 homolog, mitochondrial isoform X2 [Microcebus murinus]